MTIDVFQPVLQYFLDISKGKPAAVAVGLIAGLAFFANIDRALRLPNDISTAWRRKQRWRAAWLSAALVVAFPILIIRTFVDIASGGAKWLRPFLDIFIAFLIFVSVTSLSGLTFTIITHKIDPGCKLDKGESGSSIKSKN